MVNYIRLIGGNLVGTILKRVENIFRIFRKKFFLITFVKLVETYRQPPHAPNGKDGPGKGVEIKKF